MNLFYIEDLDRSTVSNLILTEQFTLFMRMRAKNSKQ